MRRSRKILIISAIVILSFVLVIHPIASVIVYESIFSMRFEVSPNFACKIEDFDSLSVERTQIDGEGERLTGFKYSNPTVTSPEGLVVFAHGLGSGGHNPYMPLIDALTDEGYLVFTYDATGNGESGGKGVGGLPQGPLDLGRAITAALSDSDYDGLSLYLVGHSWGAYSVGVALADYPEVEGAVMLSGFNSSADMIRESAARFVGSFVATAASPAAIGYERMKFGDASTLTVLDGIASSDARVMIVHSESDTTVPLSAGYNMYYETYNTDPRVTFLLYNNRAHNSICYNENMEPDFELISKMTDMFKGASGNLA
jgi:pimeloyl-ACP methyl ester carboxylesterase